MILKITKFHISGNEGSDWSTDDWMPGLSRCNPGCGCAVFGEK